MQYIFPPFQGYLHSHQVSSLIQEKEVVGGLMIS